MVASVYLVKPSPLLRRQWTQHGMQQNSGCRSEALLCIGQAGIHGYQRVIEPANGILAQVAGWHGVLWGLSACGEAPQS